MYLFKKILNKFTPPLIWDLFVFVYRKLRGKAHHFIYIEKEFSDTIDFESLYYVSENQIFNVSSSKVKHHGGQSYNQYQHHFMQYYQDGIEALENFYSNHQPKTVYEKHFIVNHPGCQDKLPWRSDSSSQSNGEHGLSAEHGHSAFGPVSDKKLKLEAARLDYCLGSIRAAGYVVNSDFPKQENGFPRGYFLVSNSGDWAFVVVGAKHRVAALIRLGWVNIPVCCEPNFPRCIFESDISSWPGVKSGNFSIKDAKLIFDSYFRDENKGLWQ
jgi:hypothetical protein